MKNRTLALLFRPQSFPSKNLFRIFCGWLGCLFLACGYSPWPDREDNFESELVYETMDFTIHPRRFVLVDDSVSIQIQGIKTGFACTQISELDVSLDEPNSTSELAAYTASIHGLIPGIPDCNREKTRDTTIWFRWSGIKLGIQIGLNELQSESATETYMVSGNSHMDSLFHVKNALNFTTQGSFLFRDEATNLPAMLYADSLPPCAHLNWAQGKRNLDSAWIRFETVDLDSGITAGEFGCQSEKHSDSISIQWVETSN